MSYVFDASAFSQLFRSYYRGRFSTLWDQFDELVANDRTTSTREVRREIEQHSIEALRNWVNGNSELFPKPDVAEANFVRRIFDVQHFWQVIERRKLLTGGLNADPFIIARASVLDGTVVTIEANRPNGARIPNICGHFGISWLSLERFMETENWIF